MLIKQADGAHKTKKTLRKNMCLCVFVWVIFVAWYELKSTFRSVHSTQMDYANHSG